jgi:transposase
MNRFENILRLDGGNASAIAKRVGRSAATVKRWMREGIPQAAQADCLKALSRHDASVKAAKTRKQQAKGKSKPRVKTPPPKKAAKKPTQKRVKKPEPTVVPLTKREKREQRTQLMLAQYERARLKGRAELEWMRQKNKILRHKHGRDKSYWWYLSDQVEQESDLWLAFYAMGLEIGLDVNDIKAAWFSPKAQLGAAPF